MLGCESGSAELRFAWGETGLFIMAETTTRHLQTLKVELQSVFWNPKEARGLTRSPEATRFSSGTQLMETGLEGLKTPKVSPTAQEQNPQLKPDHSTFLKELDPFINPVSVQLWLLLSGDDPAQRTGAYWDQRAQIRLVLMGVTNSMSEHHQLESAFTACSPSFSDNLEHFGSRKYIFIFIFRLWGSTWLVLPDPSPFSMFYHQRGVLHLFLARQMRIFRGEHQPQELFFIMAVTVR